MGPQGEIRHGVVPRRLAIETPFLHRSQFRHFVLFSVLPAMATVFAIVWAYYHPVGITEMVLFLAMWLMTGVGVSAGYHRLFTHRSYSAARPVRGALAVLGSMAALGSVISWAAIHRRHHECADQHGDMHSPNLHGSAFWGRVRGFFHAHITWATKHEYPNIAHYTPDLLDDRMIVRISKNYKWWVLLGLLLPAAIGGLVSWDWRGALGGLLWGGFVRMFVVAQSIATLNSVLHSMGARRFATTDNSRNNPLIGALTWGEGWHHNHHAFPTSASFALAWYCVDLSYWFILVLKRFGLAWDVRVPTKQQITSRAIGAYLPASAPVLEK